MTEGPGQGKSLALDSFSGFGPGALGFYEGLEADNSKAYWKAHETTYRNDIAVPMKALAVAIERDLGPMKIFRPNRDVRFSADKSPYKLQAGMAGDAKNYDVYLQFSADGLMLASGWYSPSSAQLAAFRQRADSDPAPFDALLSELRDQGWALQRDGALKSAPRGWPRDHPRVDLLQLTRIVVTRQHGTPGWLTSPECLDYIRTGCQQVQALGSWLTSLPVPEERPET